MLNFTCLSPDEVRGKYERARDKGYMLDALAGLTDSSVEEVAAFLGVETPVQIYRFNFDEQRARELYDQKMGDPGIAKELGVSCSVIWRWRKIRGLKTIWSRRKTPEQLAQRRALYDKGLSDGEIARREGCTSSTIRQWRLYHNLPANQQRRGT